MLSSLRSWVSTLLTVGLVLVIGGIATIAFTNAVFDWTTDSRCYDQIEIIPTRDVGLVLGASPYTLYYENRMDAAAELFKAGKVRHLLVSGDNGTVYYDETTAMKNSLIGRGVPETAITCDFAGFRTFDSVIRARKIFGQKQLVIISQAFHNSRAVYIADFNGIDAIGYNAEQPEFSPRSRTLMREVGAKTFAFFELHITGCQPRYLGRKEPIVLASVDQGL